MFTLMRKAMHDDRADEAELFGVFATEAAASSELESLIDAYRANSEDGDADVEEYEDAWRIVPILDIDAA